MHIVAKTVNKVFTNCPICKSGKLYMLKEYSKDHLVKCKNCNFVFSNFIPSGYELDKAYATYKRDNLVSDITLKRYGYLLDQFEKFRKTNNIIDVGAGDGWFLTEAKKRGWNVFGTEFEDRAVANCLDKGIDMHHGVLDPKKYNVLFDIITSFEVVEHINNPLEEFSHFYKLLRKGGMVYVTTPNFNSLSRRLLGPKWNNLAYPEHISYYTFNTLKKAFERCGFSYQKGTTSGFSFTRFRHSSASVQLKEKIVEEAGAHNKDEGLRKKIESNKALQMAKKFIDFLFHITKSGDGLKLQFIKN